MVRDTTGKVIKAEISVGKNLGHENDLPCVHREVLSDVVYGLNDVHITALNRSRLQQRLRIQSVQHGLNLGECSTQEFEQFLSRNNLRLTEFLITSALISLIAKSRDNPLAGVAAEVQCQVANTV
jgi:hypothetical protein